MHNFANVTRVFTAKANICTLAGLASLLQPHPQTLDQAIKVENTVVITQITKLQKLKFCNICTENSLRADVIGKVVKSWRHDIRHNDIRHNDTQHKGIILN